MSDHDARPDDSAGQADFRQLVQSVRDYAIFMIDVNGHVLTWNEGARRIKGYEPHEIIGQHFSVFYPEEARARRHPDYELEVAAREGRFEEEGWRVRKDGSQFWANVVITALHDATGRLRGFAKVTRDLTERRRHDEKLRLSELRLRLLIDNIRDYAVFMLDGDGRVATWNVGAERIKGYTAHEIIGQHFSVFYPREDVVSGKCDRELDIATATGRFEEEGWRVRKDGSRFWGNVIISAVRDESGQLIGFAKVTRDLSDRRSAEEERLRLARAEEAVRLRDEFLSIASHELKTPLTGLELQVSGLSRLLNKGVPAADMFDKLKSRTEVIEHELDRLSRLVNDLLDVSRAASGKLHLQLSTVDLGQAARQVAGRYAEDALRAGCALTVSAHEVVTGEWDPTRIDQIVTNFLSNAIKYGAGKPIEISVDRRGDRAVLAVRDHGIGIAPADQQRIFERFARAVSAANYGGLGLGLWIVRLIVESMGGSVTVDSRLGEGATFIASLPVKTAGDGSPLH